MLTSFLGEPPLLPLVEAGKEGLGGGGELLLLDERSLRASAPLRIRKFLHAGW